MRRFALLAVLVSACSSTAVIPTSTSGAVVTSTTISDQTTTSIPDPSTTTSSTVPPSTTTTLAPLISLGYEEVARMSFPVQMIPAGDAALIATKDGRVWSYDGTTIDPEPVLDLTERVRNGGERGLLSIATHPEDPNRLFVHYSANDGDTVVEEYSIGGDPSHPPAEQLLLRLNQPAANHNGGMIQFGPDGALYLGLGDGGGSNDRFGNGQNQDTLLGGLVRLDVGGAHDPELFQYGLRNPWRFWIEGDVIYVADVGQGSYEEVSVADLVPDVNYGWPITEGLHCFRPSSGCDTSGLTLPVVEVRHHDAGTCSITGGVVYRGTAIPEAVGHYFYSDYCGGYLRSFPVGGSPVEVVDWTDQVGTPGSVIGFGLDHLGEMYVMTTNRVLKLVANR